MRVTEDGQVIVGQSVYDCTVLDMSVGGVRISFRTPVAIPEKVLFALDGSPRVLAYRRWVRGTEVGLELVGAVPDGVDEETAVLAVNTGEQPASVTSPGDPTMYAAISPSGFVIRSTMSLTPDEARYRLGASISQLGPLARSGWQIARLTCAVVDIYELAPLDCDLREKEGEDLERS